MNRNSNEALAYHEATKHSELSLQMSAHYLDWDNKPRAFKVYTNLLSIPLPRDVPRPDQSALKCVGQLGAFDEGKTIDIARLAEILFFSAGITRELKHPSGRYFMRAASATGALYPIELYVVNSDIPGLSGESTTSDLVILLLPSSVLETTESCLAMLLEELLVC